jgi:acyl-CoA reductase-like NAD-dependent aldehyde dehydrogenase
MTDVVAATRDSSQILGPVDSDPVGWSPVAMTDDYGVAATVLTASMSHAWEAWRALPVGTVKTNAVFGGAPGGAAQPRGASGIGFGHGPEFTTTKVVHIGLPGTDRTC